MSSEDGESDRLLSPRRGRVDPGREATEDSDDRPQASEGPHPRPHGADRRALRDRAPARGRRSATRRWPTTATGCAAACTRTPPPSPTCSPTTGGRRPHRRAAVRGDGARHRRRARRRLHPVGVRVPRGRDPRARLPQPLAVPGPLDEGGAGAARRAGRPSGDRRRAHGGRGSSTRRWPPGARRWPRSTCQSIGYWHLPAEMEGRGGYPVVVYAIDGDVVHVDDRVLAPRPSRARCSTPRGRGWARTGTGCA